MNLSNNDQEWFVGQLTSLGTRMIERIDLVTERTDLMTERIDLMTGRIDLMTGRIDLMTERIDEVMERIDEAEGRMRALNTTTNERVERVETALLTEFHKWESPTDARIRSHSTTIQAIDIELEALKGRVERLETKAS